MFVTHRIQYSAAKHLWPDKKLLYKDQFFFSATGMTSIIAETHENFA